MKIISTILFFLIALLYSSAGFGGASLYLSVLSFTNLGHDSIAIMAMICNITAVSMSGWNYIKAGFLRWKAAFVLLSISIPASFIGGMIKISPFLFSLILGLTLIISGILIICNLKSEGQEKPLQISWEFGGLTGGLIGLISGLVGIGGGVFLAPLLILKKIGNPKEIAALCALFILVNSIAGIIARVIRLSSFPVNQDFVYLWLAVAGGSFIGSWLGSKKLPFGWIRNVIAFIVIFSGTNQLFKCFKML